MSTTTATTMSTPSLPRAASTPRHTDGRATRHPRPWTYTRVEILATLRRPDTIFFTILMPVGMYLLFGQMSDFSTTDIGRGNISASIMVNMSTYSAAIAATSVAASAAVEQAGGWGRQVALTPGGMRTYVVTKLLTALAIATLPVAIIFAAGAATAAQLDAPWVWVSSFVLALVAAIPFSLFGLAAGLWVPAQGAVGVASASVSVLAFLGNIFMPLNGILFTIAHYTPLYGPGNLAVRPIQGDVVASMTGSVTEALWIPVTNLVAWTLFFALLCLLARHRGTVRR